LPIFFIPFCLSFAIKALLFLIMIPLLLPCLLAHKKRKTFSSLHGCVLIYDGRRGKKWGVYDNDDDEENNWGMSFVCKWRLCDVAYKKKEGKEIVKK
jgi:hypothetical protein